MARRNPESAPRARLGTARAGRSHRLGVVEHHQRAALLAGRSAPGGGPRNQFQIDFVRCLWAILPAACLWGASFPLALAAVACRGSRRGIATTCLAETIGEDVDRLSKIFYEKHPESNVKLIPIKSPGYGGTQYGGYFTALRAVVENVEMESGHNEKINIVTGPISSADTRELKEILNDFGVDYILLPDISESLDGVIVKNIIDCQTVEQL